MNTTQMMHSSSQVAGRCGVGEAVTQRRNYFPYFNSSNEIEAGGSVSACSIIHLTPEADSTINTGNQVIFPGEHSQGNMDAAPVALQLASTSAVSTDARTDGVSFLIADKHGTVIAISSAMFR